MLYVGAKPNEWDQTDTNTRIDSPFALAHEDSFVECAVTMEFVERGQRPRGRFFNTRGNLQNNQIHVYRYK